MCMEHSSWTTFNSTHTPTPFGFVCFYTIFAQQFQFLNENWKQFSLCRVKQLAKHTHKRSSTSKASGSVKQTIQLCTTPSCVLNHIQKGPRLPFHCMHLKTRETSFEPGDWYFTKCFRLTHHHHQHRNRNANFLVYRSGVCLERFDTMRVFNVCD